MQKMVEKSIERDTMDGLGFLSPTKLKKIQAAQPQVLKPKPKVCPECNREGHFSFECKAQPPKATPSYMKSMAFNAQYALARTSDGKVKLRFFGPRDKKRPRQVWVPKSLITTFKTPHDSTSSSTTKTPKQVWVAKSQA